MHGALGTLIQDMFHLPIPLTEKIVRPLIVYLSLVVVLRLFGKRELAQLNPFDLVVLLSLSNTVQNAIIADDNSVTGGIVGAFSLVAVSWLLRKLLSTNTPMIAQPLAVTDCEVTHHLCALVSGFQVWRVTRARVGRAF